MPGPRAQRLAVPRTARRALGQARHRGEGLAGGTLLQDRAPMGVAVAHGGARSLGPNAPRPREGSRGARGLGGPYKQSHMHCMPNYCTVQHRWGRNQGTFGEPKD